MTIKRERIIRYKKVGINRAMSEIEDKGLLQAKGGPPQWPLATKGYNWNFKCKSKVGEKKKKSVAILNYHKIL